MQFSYKAKQGPAKIVEGFVESDTLDGAIAQIVRLGLTPVDVQGIRGRSMKRNVVGQLVAVSARRRTSGVPLNELMLFTRQISDLVDAGIPMLRALVITQKQIRHPYFADVISQIQNVVKDGGTFSDALAKFPNVFSRLYANMVRAGELGGNLNVVLNRLADYIERDQEIKSQIHSSLLYPAFVLVVGVLAVFGLLTWVVPKITLIFEDLGEALPWPTVVLLAVSGFLSRFWWMVVAVSAAVIFYVRRLLRTPAGKFWLDGLQLRIPLLGMFVRDIQIGQFARTLGTLLNNGVTILAALEAVSLVVDNELLKEEIKRLTQEVANGASLTQALKSSSLFPEAAVSMVSVGEEAGQTHDGLYKLAVYYERRTQNVIKGALSLLGPVLILVIGLVVFFVVIAMLMPIFQMNLIIK